MRQDHGVLVPDRRRLLLAQVRRLGSAEVETLADALAVSASTIRRDLALLEAEGLLTRAHGGAYVRGSVSANGADIAMCRSDTATSVKARIGQAAARYVDDGMTVMILAGSTTAAMLPHLAGRSLTVVTNGLDIGHTLAAEPDITVVMLGGVLHREQMTLLGPLTEQSMADLHVDALFAGAWGISPDVGVTGDKVIQAGYHHSMLQHTDSLVVLADASKFGRRGPTVLAGIDQVDHFVTDVDVPTPVADDLRDRGADVVTC